jgi:myo-inositol-1(or 4)-monophosphatase
MGVINNLPLSRSGRSPFEVANQAVQEAGRVLIDHFHSKKAIKQKSRGNLVTEVDTLAEELILGLLKNEYPDHHALSEEANSLAATTGYTWIVDPLDGTNNYVFGIPDFCINIALANDADILLGMTYDPVRKELFYAEKGRGAYLNGSSVWISPVSWLKDALVAFDLGYDEKQGKKMLTVINKLWGQVHCMRMIGSSALALAYVACGRFTIYFHRHVYPWDIASGLLLVREAGGIVADWQGSQAGFQAEKIVATNNKLYQQLMKYLN